MGGAGGTVATTLPRLLGTTGAAYGGGGGAVVAAEGGGGGAVVVRPGAAGATGAPGPAGGIDGGSGRTTGATRVGFVTSTLVTGAPAARGPATVAVVSSATSSARITLEQREQVLRARAPVRRRHEGRAERLRERRRQPRDVDVAQRHAPEHHRHRPVAERRPARGREDQHRGPAPPVPRLARGGTGHHLGVDVARRPGHHARLGVPDVVLDLGDAEVDEHGAVVGEHHVGRLDVPVHHPGRVDRGDRLEEPAREPGQLVRLERAVLGHGVLERLAVDQLGDDERLVRVGLGVEHACHARVPDPVQRGDLAPEPVPRRRIRADLRVEELEGDAPVVGVDRLVDRPHAAAADLAHEDVTAELLARAHHAPIPAPHDVNGT